MTDFDDLESERARLRLLKGCTCRVWKTDKPCEQWLLTRKCAQTEQWLNSLFGADVKLELELKERGET